MNISENHLALQDWPPLVKAAREGCEEALGEIITRLQGYLLLIANGQVRDNLQAKFGASDIVQNSLLDVHAGIDQFDGTTEAEMRAWLKTIVLRNFLDEKRRYTNTHSRRLQLERPLETMITPLSRGTSETGSKEMRHAEELQQLSQALNRLPPLQQRVIEGRRRFGYSYQQIADQLGITEAAARKIWSRAIKQLKTYLAEED